MAENAYARPPKGQEDGLVLCRVDSRGKIAIPALGANVHADILVPSMRRGGWQLKTCAIHETRKSCAQALRFSLNLSFIHI